MIGIIQNVLSALVTGHGGDTPRTAVFERAGVAPEKTFRIDRNYSDAECLALLEATVAETGLSRDELFDLYAPAFLTRARVLFPRFFEMCADSREFLKMQPEIHAMIGAGLQDPEERHAIANKFTVAERDDHSISVTYRSPNGLCALYRSLARASADQFGDRIEIETVRCSCDDGGESCEMVVTWPT